MSVFAGAGVGGVGAARAGAAGLAFPDGDPEGLRGAARQAGAAAGLMRSSAAGLGANAAGASSWEGAAAESFRGAVDEVRGGMGAAAGRLEGVAGALDRLALVIDDAQQEVLSLAARVEEAEQAAEAAEAREAIANLAAAGAGAALELFGPDPPPALEGAKQDAEEAAGRAGRGAVAARAAAVEVRRSAEAKAREICQDCVREDQTTAGVVESTDLGGAAGSGFGVGPGAGFAATVADRMTVSDLKELAFLRAGIDATAWNPRKGLDANDEIVRSVYAYYRKLALEYGEFQWMKMAAVGGPLFYAGFRDIDAAGDAAEEAGSLPFPGGLGTLGADDLRWYEGQFLTMQKAIFSDLAWQHEAFALGGAAAIHGAVAKLAPSERRGVMDSGTESAWDDIGSGDPDRVRRGNFRLIEREQLPVIQRYYDQMSDRFTGGLVTGQLTDRADTPIPGSETYRDYSDEGNIANYDDRIAWIRESLWPAHQQQLQSPGAVEGLLARDFDSEVARYRQVTPGAIGKDVLHGAVDAGEEILKRIPPPQPILPPPLWKLTG